MQSHANLARAGLAGAIFAVLAACTPPPPGITYDEYVSPWVGGTETGLVSAWGIPQNTHTLETGGRIVEYTRTQGTEVVCTTRFNIDQTGNITKYWYRGSHCRAPSGG